MTATKIGIIYATGSKMIRRVVLPDDDAQLSDPAWLGQGESLLLADIADGNDPVNPQYVNEQVEKETGVAPPDPACAVINDNGVVEAVIAADPEIDAVPDKVLAVAYSKEIGAGCMFDEKTGEFTIPTYVIAAGVDKQGNAVAEKIVAERKIEKPIPVDSQIDAKG